MGFSKPKPPSKRKVPDSEPVPGGGKKRKLGDSNAAVDLAPKSVAEKSVSNEPLPKSFRRLLAKQQRLTTPRPATSKNNDAGRKSKIDHSKLKRLKGESLQAFSRRLDDEIRQSVNQAARAETKTFAKRKARLEERKQKRKEKQRKGKTKEEMEANKATKDVPAFGVQAQEPPKLTVIPKKVGGGAGAQRALAAALAKKEEEEERNNNSNSNNNQETSNSKASSDRDEPSVGRKVKLKHKPLVQQKLLGEQRQIAIDAYRRAKQLQAIKST